jgi:hypothetical protein
MNLIVSPSKYLPNNTIRKPKFLDNNRLKILILQNRAFTELFLIPDFENTAGYNDEFMEYMKNPGQLPGHKLQSDELPL